MLPILEESKRSLVPEVGVEEPFVSETRWLLSTHLKKLSLVRPEETVLDLALTTVLLGPGKLAELVPSLVIRHMAEAEALARTGTSLVLPETRRSAASEETVVLAGPTALDLAEVGMEVMLDGFT